MSTATVAPTGQLGKLEKIKKIEKFFKLKENRTCDKEYIRITVKNNACNMELRNSSHFSLTSSQNSKLMMYL